MPEKMVKDIQEICDGYTYERSEFIRMCLREKIYGELSGEGELNEVRGEKILKEVTRDEMKKEVEKDEKEIIKNEKLEKARKALADFSKKPMFCPKHRAGRIGDKYTCGCEV